MHDKPAPAPLPEEVNGILRAFADEYPNDTEVVRSHLTAQARQIEELRKENVELHEEVSRRVKAASRAELHEDQAKARVEQAEAERDAAIAENARMGERHIHELAREIAWKDEHSKKRQWAEEAFAKADAENEQLKAERDWERAQNAMWQEHLTASRANCTVAEAERDALRERCEKLEKIPHHHAKWCGITDYYSKGPCKCTCGLEAALSS